MKPFCHFSLFLCIFCFSFFCESQENTLEINKNNPIYNYSEVHLNNTDTIPDYDSQLNKLKIFGTIYESDGLTPAKNVMLYIEQANEFGDFELKKKNDKRYVYHRAWIKTGADGHYTFFTFVPGNDRRYKLLKQLFPIIKAPSDVEYALNSFLFDDDPLLTKLCRKRIAKKGGANRILKPKQENDLLVVEKNIVLKNTKSNS